METEEAIEIIRKSLEQIPFLRKKERHGAEHTRWLQSTGLNLGRILGRESIIVINFTNIVYGFTGGLVEPKWPETMDSAINRKELEGYFKGLDMAQGILESAIEQLKTVGLEEIRRESGHIIKSEAIKIFISHGKFSEALNRLERFVRASGFEPVIVQYSASKGKAVDDLVPDKMDECECAMILATADDKVIDDYKNEHFQPRVNVIHEIGLAQEKFKEKVIYLREEGCNFPSNVSPKVWENFTQDNMEKAFEKIIKELRAFNFIQ